MACYTPLYYKMKQKLSITIEENTIGCLNEVVDEGRFRSKSHAIEFSINKVLNDKQDSNQEINKNA